jgi:hypothetical protein
MLVEVFHLEAKLGDYILGCAAGEAVEERPSVLALRDGEARILVVVRRAQGLVVRASLLHALQPLQDEI